MEKIFVIPAYEPDEKLVNLIKNLKKETGKIIVCDDGSGKKYESIFQKIKKDVTLIQYEINMGKGYALKKAFEWIQKNIKEESIIVTMDCDGQHKITDALKLIQYEEAHLGTIVLGKRIRNGTIPLRSKIGNSITRKIYQLVSGLDIYDTQTGLRVFSSNLLDFLLKTSGNRYEYEMNILLEAAQQKIPMKEIEIETIYINNNSGSHFHTLKDSFQIYKQIMKFSCSSIISFFIDYIGFILFQTVLHNLTLANIFARIISSCINFFMNRKYVFQSKKEIAKSAMEYFILVCGILIINTLFLNILSDWIPYYLAKIIIEMILFFLSWWIQKHYIFSKNKKI